MYIITADYLFQTEDVKNNFKAFFKVFQEEKVFFASSLIKQIIRSFI